MSFLHLYHHVGVTCAAWIGTKFLPGKQDVNVRYTIHKQFIYTSFEENTSLYCLFLLKHCLYQFDPYSGIKVWPQKCNELLILLVVVLVVVVVVVVVVVFRGELSYLASLGSENISAPHFKQCFFRGGGLPPKTELNTTPPSPKTEITNILFYILNFASIIKFKM